MPEPFLLDCDTGIDDAMAILYLLSDPAAEVVAITTVSGNCTATQAASNTLSLLTMAGRSDIPVAVGAHDPLARAFDGGAPHVHGDNGVGKCRPARAGRRAGRPGRRHPDRRDGPRARGHVEPDHHRSADQHRPGVAG